LNANILKVADLILFKGASTKEHENIQKHRPHTYK